MRKYVPLGFGEMVREDGEIEALNVVPVPELAVREDRAVSTIVVNNPSPEVDARIGEIDLAVDLVKPHVHEGLLKYKADGLFTDPLASLVWGNDKADLGASVVPLDVG